MSPAMDFDKALSLADSRGDSKHRALVARLKKDKATKSLAHSKSPRRRSSHIETQSVVSPAREEDISDLDEDTMTSSTTATRKSSEKVEISRGELKKFNQTIEKGVKDVQKFSTLVGKQKEVIKKLQDERKTMVPKSTTVDLTAKNKALSDEIVTLKAKIKKLEEQLEAGKVSKDDMSKDIVEAIKKLIKTTIFRTKKFASGSKLIELTENIYKALKTDLNLDGTDRPISETRFVKVYKGLVGSQLGVRRQYTQTRLLKAVQVWYDEHKENPTIDMMKNVWTLPDEKDPAFDKAAKFLIWYVDEWLQHAAGHDNWGPTIRYWKLPVETRLIGGKEKILVTVQSEAFAWLILDNCSEKWKEITEYRRDDPKRKIPDYSEEDKETHKFYNTKWSDSHNGAVVGGGWHKDAYPKFNEYMKLVDRFRKEDGKKGYETMTLAKDWLREIHDIDSPEYSRKKKKKKNDTTPVDPDTFDEIDDYAD